MSLCPWSPTPVTLPPKHGLLSEGTSTSVNSVVPQNGRRQAGRRCQDTGPLPSPLCSPSSQSLTSERAAARPGQGLGEGGGARALSRAWGGGAQPGWEECAGEGRAGGGRGEWRVLAVLSGAGDRARETCAPRHISPCGHPAAQISYLKPKQICGELRREQACDINQLSLLTIVIKQMPAAQPGKDAGSRAGDRISLQDNSRMSRPGVFSWAEWPLQDEGLVRTCAKRVFSMTPKPHDQPCSLGRDQTRYRRSDRR